MNVFKPLVCEIVICTRQFRIVGTEAAESVWIPGSSEVMCVENIVRGCLSLSADPVDTKDKL
jgi:hypothetical protein